jgi:ATP-binding cassette subfamily B protein
MSYGTLLMFLVISFRIYLPIESIGSTTGLMRLMDASLNRVEQIRNIPLLDEKDIDREINGYDIEFKNVTFSYEARDVIKNMSFKIKENTMTALVGSSGSGKTTITNLIARFWDVQKGKITIGGTNIKDMKCESILSHISIVFQNVYLFNDSIINNIKFGKPEATKEEVIEAAKKARCHEFIEKLENGYDTIIGQGGSTLSGGEKQRISIARAILKDAPIIFLDEATASIDPENEQKIQQAINELIKNKTLIVIAHRLSTIKNADQILVIEEGELAEKGKHEQLLDKDGIYANYWKRRQKANNWKFGSTINKNDKIKNSTAS